MSIRGRKPKPNSAKKLAGNPGKRALNQNSPNFQGPRPRKPVGFPYHAGALWDKLSGTMYDHGLLTMFDTPAFEGLCWSFHFMKEASKILKRDGLMLTDRDGDSRKHPANQIYRDNLNLVMKIAADFGMTPSSRSRLPVGQPEDEMTLAELLFSMVEDEESN